MAIEISWEIREDAEELYITGGYTYDQVSEATGVSVSQLKRWGKEGDWTERKHEYRKALSDIKRKTVLLKGKLLDKAMTSLDPQSVYAFSSITQATKNNSQVKIPAPAISDQKFETQADAIEALEKAVQKKINNLISVSGELDFKSIQDLKKALDLLEEMKAGLSDDTAETQTIGLTGEQAEFWREQVLGIK